MLARRIALVIALFVIVLFAGIWFGRINEPIRSSKTSPAQAKVIQAAGQSIRVDLAISPAERERGLGGRTGLSDGEGMLFVFDTDAKHAFWMKDMRFSIDIIWIAADGTVAYIVPSLSPSSYPASYAPPSPVRFVLELAAGWAERHGLKEGDKISI